MNCCYLEPMWLRKRLIHRLMYNNEFYMLGPKNIYQYRITCCYVKTNGLYCIWSPKKNKTRLSFVPADRTFMPLTIDKSKNKICSFFPGAEYVLNRLSVDACSKEAVLPCIFQTLIVPSLLEDKTISGLKWRTSVT